MEQTQLLIIGNGFDLTCGLKTSYLDFYNACIKDKYIVFHQGSDPSDFWQYLLCCYEQVNNQNDRCWCDVEKIMYNTLHEINNVEKQKTFQIAWSYVSNRRDPEELTSSDSINQFLKRYIAYYLYKLHPDKRSSVAQALVAFNYHLLKELKSLEKQFCEYLNSQIPNKKDFLLPDDCYAINALRLFNKLFGVCVFNVNNERSDVNFSSIGKAYILSFNYTCPLQYARLSGKVGFINVHGKLCEKDCHECQGSSVIFGIDDKEAKGSNDLHLFSKTYRKLFMKDDAKSILPDKKKQVIIKFYGHSLNAADYSYFQSIFDYYDVYGNSFVSLEFYYSIYNTKKSAEITATATDGIYRLINEYGDTLNNKDQGKNLMHKLFLENRIKIKII